MVKKLLKLVAFMRRGSLVLRARMVRIDSVFLDSTFSNLSDVEHIGTPTNIAAPVFDIEYSCIT